MSFNYKTIDGKCQDSRALFSGGAAKKQRQANNGQDNTQRLKAE